MEKLAMKDIFTFNYQGKDIRFDLTNQDDHIHKLIRSTENFYEIEMLEDIHSRVKKSYTMIDVGAYMGNHSVYFGLVCNANVYSFEPCQESFSQLKENIKLNGLEDNVKLYNCALGAERQKGRIKLVEDGNAGMNQVELDDTGTIEVHTLDKLLLDEVYKVDVIKIDVEGMELDVLKGAKQILKRDMPLLYIECFDEEGLKDITRFLMRLGYKNEGVFNATPTYLFKSTTVQRIGFWAGDINNFQFLEPIIDYFKDEYEVAKYTFEGDEGLLCDQIKACDVAWFEWGNGPVVAASNLDGVDTPIICRIHRYEAYDDATLNSINWNSIKKIIVVADYIKEMLSAKIEDIAEKIEVIPNGIDVEKFDFDDRSSNFNIAFLGRLHWHKDPLFALQCFYNLYQKDSRYHIHFAGRFCDNVIEQKFYYLIKELGIENNVVYDGHVDDVNEWLNDKGHIICSSIVESQNIAVMEAMAKGIKPLVYNFFGAKDIYPEEYIFNSPDEFSKKVLSEGYTATEYRTFVERSYNFPYQAIKIRNTVSGLTANNSAKNRSLIPIDEIDDITLTEINSLDEWDILISDDRFFSPEDLEHFQKYLKRSKADLIKVPVVYPLIEGHHIARWEIAAIKNSPKTGSKESVGIKVAREQDVLLPYSDALVLFIEKHLEEALQAFIGLYQTSTDPKERVVYLRWIALCLIELGRDDQARNILDDALQVHEDNADLYYLSLLVDLLQGDYTRFESKIKTIQALGEAISYPEFIANIETKVLELVNNLAEAAQA